MIFLCLTLARLIVLGDSIGVGQGASDSAHTYASILAAELRMPLDNRSVGATVVAQQALPTDLHPGDVVVWMAGYNDMRAGHDAVEVAATVQAAAEAMRAQGATVYIASPIPMTTAGYATYGPEWNRGSDALRSAYQAELPNAIRIAFDVRNVDADLVHPNDAGHRQIANAFLTAMRRRVYLPIL